MRVYACVSTRVQSLFQILCVRARARACIVRVPYACADSIGALQRGGGTGCWAGAWGVAGLGSGHSRWRGHFARVCGGGEDGWVRGRLRARTHFFINHVRVGCVVGCVGWCLSPWPRPALRPGLCHHSLCTSTSALPALSSLSTPSPPSLAPPPPPRLAQVDNTASKKTLALGDAYQVRRQGGPGRQAAVLPSPPPAIHACPLPTSPHNRTLPPPPQLPCTVAPGVHSTHTPTAQRRVPGCLLPAVLRRLSPAMTPHPFPLAFSSAPPPPPLLGRSTAPAPLWQPASCAA